MQHLGPETYRKLLLFTIVWRPDFPFVPMPPHPCDASPDSIPPTPDSLKSVHLVETPKPKTPKGGNMPATFNTPVKDRSVHDYHDDCGLAFTPPSKLKPRRSPSWRTQTPETGGSGLDSCDSQLTWVLGESPPKKANRGSSALFGKMEGSKGVA